MANVKTLVYFDIEATGLKSSGKPRICELSLIAVNIQDVLSLNLKIKCFLDKDNSESDLRIAKSLSPRIVNKLTICVYPMATIVPLVSDLTGLDNYNLTDQSKFSKNTGELINSFLALLPSPVCLVAHNGNAYDFPLLKAELEKSGTKLDSKILCVDSYVGIKEIFMKRSDLSKKEGVGKIKSKESADLKIAKMEVDAVTDLVNLGYFDSPMDGSICDGLMGLSKNLEVSKQENEITPKGQVNRPDMSLTPHKQEQTSFSGKFTFQRKLDFSNPICPKSFSLINLHKFFLGCPPDGSHGAEADCLALLRTTAMLGDKWIDWVKNNCYLFEKCRKMWG
jgi:DNA polymerase III epsilon subunit-like protein